MGLVEADFDKKKPATFKMEVMKEALKIVDPSALLGVVGEVGPRLVIKPFVYNPQISPRQLISIGGMRSYAKGFLSLTGAAGGVGKSTQSIAEELSLVTGKDLLTQLPGFPAPPLKCGRQRVWVMSLEDDEKEHQRRVNAALKLYGIDPKELVGWYFVTYKNDSPVNVASVSNGVFVANPQVQLIGQAIKDHAIDVLIVDPFVNSHSIPENDNGTTNKVADIWRTIAQENMVALVLTHHLRKGNGMGEVSADDLRGAVALVSAARIVRVLAPMSKDEASRYGIDPDRRRFYYWINPSAKGNLTPPCDDRLWFRLASVDLDNGTDEWVSDSLGVAEYWQPPQVTMVGTDDDHSKVYQAFLGVIASDYANKCRCSANNEKWFGHLIGGALRLDTKDKNIVAKIKSLIAAWEAKEIIYKEDFKDSTSRDRKCYLVNPPPEKTQSSREYQ